MKQAVIFDVDGVLVDSYQAHFDSWVQLFAELGYAYSEDEFRAGFGRTSGENLVQWAQKNGQAFSTEKVQELDNRKEAIYRQVISQNFAHIEGAVELIDALDSAGFALAIGSSGPPENIAVVLEALDRKNSFSAVVSRADVTRGKPDPAIFLTAAERLDIPPSACAVIEDACPGVAAANAAGMTSIALVGTATREELSTADLVVDKLCQLDPGRIATVIAARR